MSMDDKTRNMRMRAFAPFLFFFLPYFALWVLATRNRYWIWETLWYFLSPILIKKDAQRAALRCEGCFYSAGSTSITN